MAPGRAANPGGSGIAGATSGSKGLGVYILPLMTISGRVPFPYYTEHSMEWGCEQVTNGILTQSG